MSYNFVDFSFYVEQAQFDVRKLLDEVKWFIEGNSMIELIS